MGTLLVSLIGRICCNTWYIMRVVIAAPPHCTVIIKSAKNEMNWNLHTSILYRLCTSPNNDNNDAMMIKPPKTRAVGLTGENTLQVIREVV